MNTANVIENLKKTLAEEYTLQTKTQNYHWNIEGPLFYSLHKLFEAQYGEISEYVDSTAETLRALNTRAPGSFSEFKSLSSIQEAPAEKQNAGQMIEALTQDHTKLAAAFKERLEEAEENQVTNAVTLYEDLITFHEKAAWMIRSHRS